MKTTLKHPNQSMQQAIKCSFILRLWRVNQSDAPSWRASIEIPESGRRFGFASLEQMFAFLINFTETNCELSLLQDEKKEIGSI